MEKLKTFQFEVPIYNNIINVVVGEDYDEFLAFLKSHKLRWASKWELGSKADAVTNNTKNGIIIRFKDNPPPGDIAHEAFHAVFMILHDAGMVPSTDSEEAYAYLIDYVVSNIHKGIYGTV